MTNSSIRKFHIFFRFHFLYKRAISIKYLQKSGGHRFFFDLKKITRTRDGIFDYREKNPSFTLGENRRRKNLYYIFNINEYLKD